MDSIILNRITFVIGTNHLSRYIACHYLRRHNPSFLTLFPILQLPKYLISWCIGNGVFVKIMDLHKEDALSEQPGADLLSRISS